MKASLSAFDSFRHLKPRERRVVVAGSVVSAAMMATVWLVLPFAQHWSSRAARLATAQERWGRLAMLVANSGRLSQTLESAKHASASDEGRLVAGATPALAASSLQELVQRDASESAIQLERVDAAGEPQADKSGLLAIPVELQARGDLYGFVAFLTRLEQGSPLVVIDEMTVNGGLDADEDVQAAAAASAPRQTLSWTLHLHGLYEGPPETGS
jgi:type II secretory pathway component PulM